MDGREATTLGDGTTLSSRDADPEALPGVDVQSNERREADTLRFNQRREADPDALPSTGPPSNERREADPEVQGNDD